MERWNDAVTRKRGKERERDAENKRNREKC